MKAITKLKNDVTIIRSLFFDGKKSDAVTYKDGRRTMNQEDQYSVVSFPGKEYLGYFSAEGSRQTKLAKVVAQNLFLLVSTFKIDKTMIDVIGGDGCNANTGPWGGSFGEFEQVCVLKKCLCDKLRLLLVSVGW